MTTKWMETPDALNGTTGDSQASFWTKTGTVTYDTTIKKSGAGSWKADAGAGNADANLHTGTGVMADAGRRVSAWMYFTSVSGSVPVIHVVTTGFSAVFDIVFSSSKLQIKSGSTTKTGSTTVTTSAWHRVSVSYVITSTSNYTIKLWLDGNLEATMTASDGNLATTGSSILYFGCVGAGFGASQQCYFQHTYVDDSTALTDVGDIRVTAKRPNANGSSNQFTTQIGSGGSGYGTGHSPQVNERPASTTNGWQAPTTSGVKTEGYALESSSTGDVDISGTTQVAYLGWLIANTTGSGGAPTNHILLNGNSTTITLSGTSTLFTSIVDSSSYPTTSVVIGADHSGTGKATQLTECGVMVAYLGQVSSQQKFSARLYQMVGASKKFSSRLYQMVGTSKKFVGRLYQLTGASKKFSGRFGQLTGTSKKFAGRLYQDALVSKTFKSRLNQLTGTNQQFKSRFFQTVLSKQFFVARFNQLGNAYQKFSTRFYQYISTSQKFSARFFQSALIAKTYSARIYQIAKATQRFSSRFYQVSATAKIWTARFGHVGTNTAQQIFIARFSQLAGTTKRYSARLFHSALAPKIYRNRLFQVDQTSKAYRARFSQKDMSVRAFKARLYQYDKAAKAFKALLCHSVLAKKSYSSRIYQYDKTARIFKARFDHSDTSLARRIYAARLSHSAYTRKTYSCRFAHADYPIVIGFSRDGRVTGHARDGSIACHGRDGSAVGTSRDGLVVGIARDGK